MKSNFLWKTPVILKSFCEKASKTLHGAAIPLRSCVMTKDDVFLAVSKMREGPSVSVTRDRDQTALCGMH
jgi:hypothetical protein